jgi:hypothetical protein
VKWVHGTGVMEGTVANDRAGRRAERRAEEFIATGSVLYGRLLLYI